MKLSLYFLPFILFFIPQANYSQKNILHYGIKAGLDNFKYASNKYENQKNNTFGYYAGIFANYKINDEFRIQPEMLYTIHNRDEIIRDAEVDYGWDYNVSLLGDASFKVKEVVIQLPLILQFYITNDFHVDFGPQLNYIYDKKWTLNDDFYIGGSEATLANAPEYDRLDVGLNIGTGYYFNSSFGINARFYQGVVQKDDEIYSGVFTLGMELRF